MSFTWFADRPLRSREQVMEVIVRVADDLGMPDKKGACIIAGMTVAQEAGDDETGDRIPEFWCPANPTGDPETLKYQHDSTSNEDRSSGYYQQQPPWWGTAAQRMDLYESTKMFMTSLKRYPYRASNAQEANTWAQKVQGSSFPNAYTKWWQLANDVYNNVKGVAVPPPAAPPATSYGLPRGARITYGSPGFPAWVYELGARFNVKASTYAGHQETDRIEAGYARNPARLNRGIDWAGSVADMQRFAEYLMTVRGGLEQLIWQNPQTGQRIGVAGGKDIGGGYYGGEWANHRDHVHTRQDRPIPLPGGAPAPRPPAPPDVHTTGDPVWLADVLRAEGLTVVEMPGWRDRGHGDFGDIWGIVAHHTGSNNASPESIAFHPSLGLASQIHLARNGVVTLCGVGIAWHAGNGSWPGLPTNGANSRTIGIEAANDGGGSSSAPLKHRSSWPDVQYDAYVRVCAAILRKLGRDQSRVIGHKEWAGKAQGKWDPGRIDMNIFRADIAARLSNTPTQPEGDDDLTPDQARMLQDIHRELTQKHPSRSAMREPGEGAVDTWAGMDLNTDGNVDFLATFLRASLNFPPAIERLERVATGIEPGRNPNDALLAQAILAKVTNPEPTVINNSAPTTDGREVVAAVTAAVHDAVSAMPAPVVYAEPAPSTKFTGTPGQIIGQLYDAIAAFDVNADLPPESKATLQAAIGILQAKVGSPA